MEEKQEFKGKYKNIIFTIIGIAVVVLISTFSTTGGEGTDLAWSNLNIGTVVYTFIAGAIAISAMVLPGISGSTLLLIFGLYMPIISAIKGILTLNFAYLPIVCVFGIGCLIGIVTVIKLIRKALKSYRSQTMHVIIGLMIGSLYAIVLGPTTLEVAQPALSLSTFSLIFFLIGGVIIVGLQQLKKATTNKEK